MFSAQDPRPAPGSGSFAVPCEDARVIRAVLFDADGVLQGARPGWKDRLAALVPADRADEFVTELFAAELPPLRGESSWPDELAKVLARWNVAVPLDDVLANWHDIVVYPDELDVVRAGRALRRRQPAERRRRPHRRPARRALPTRLRRLRAARATNPVRRPAQLIPPRAASPCSDHSSHLVVPVDNRSCALRRSADRVVHRDHEMRRMIGEGLVDPLPGD